jgi:hypothetical protein
LISQLQCHYRLADLILGEKGSCGQEGWVVKEIGTIKKKSSVLHQDNRKDTTRTSREVARPYLSQAARYKIVNLLQRLSLEKTEPLGTLLTQGHLRKYFLGFSCLGPPEATAAQSKGAQTLLKLAPGLGVIT